MLINLIAGAGPNFIKIAPIIHAIEKTMNDGQPIRYQLAHTGQHHDHKMSKRFFEEFNIPEPDVNLESG